MRFEDLDSRQREVVEAVLESNARILVLGGPGTGKTTTALWTARAYLATSDERPAPRVLFLTFSRSAVSQIMSRSPGVLSGFEDRIEILTFHALAYRLLRAFSRYAGYGTATPSIQSEARGKLLGHDRSKLRYGDLIPGVLRLLENSERIRQLLASRWGLVICDEAQDTNMEQWRLLQILASRKLLLLGDANQMIYTFIPGVSPERFRQMREWADREIELNPRSHRDPSGAIPALAEAIRRRQFDHEVVAEALRNGRLTIHFDVDRDRHPDLLGEAIKEARRQGSRDVGIFVHSNAAVAELADQLNNVGIDHVLVGIPEAHAEALASMATQCAYAMGLATDDEVRESLALFLTATVRSQQPPQLARALIGIGELALPGLIDEAVQQLEIALAGTIDGTMEDLAGVAMQSWEGLGIHAGFRPWRRAAAHFRRLVGPLRQLPVSEDSVRRLVQIVERSRIEALIDLDYSERGTVKLMNYHQTKGREADTVIHVFRPDDYFGQEVEPFEETSRLLNVAISRARHRVVIVLPPEPHPLVQPFAALRPSG
jgi:DNA helicase-2/ATP-dependent DNA helicase PcrA